MKLKYALISAISTAAVSLGAHAQIVVYDPANMGQSVLTAVRTLQSNINEAQMLANQLKNLQQLNFTASPDFLSSYTQYLSQLKSVRQSLGDLLNLEQNFQQTYPTFRTMQGYNNQQMVQQLSGWQDNLNTALTHAYATSGNAIAAAPATQSNINNAVSASENSQGSLQVTQAGNQLIATVGTQLTQMNGQMGTYYAAHTQYMAQQQSREAMQDQMYDQVYSDLHKTPAAHTPAPFPGTIR